MPPAPKKTTTVLNIPSDTTVIHVDPYALSVGKVVNISISGKTLHRSAEILAVSGSGLIIRSNPSVPPGTEITFVPWTAIEGVGFCGAR
jgi:hypothetical protein